MQINGYQTLPATFIKQSRAEPDFEVSVRDACISQFTKNKVMRQGFSSTLWQLCDFSSILRWGGTLKHDILTWIVWIRQREQNMSARQMNNVTHKTQLKPAPGSTFCFVYLACNTHEKAFVCSYLWSAIHMQLFWANIFSCFAGRWKCSFYSILQSVIFWKKKKACRRDLLHTLMHVHPKHVDSSKICERIKNSGHMEMASISHWRWQVCSMQTQVLRFTFSLAQFFNI